MFLFLNIEKDDADLRISSSVLSPISGSNIEIICHTTSKNVWIEREDGNILSRSALLGDNKYLKT